MAKTSNIGDSAPAVINARLTYFIFFSVAICVMGLIGKAVVGRVLKLGNTKINWWFIPASLVASTICGVILWWIGTRLLSPEYFAASSGFDLQIYVSFAVPLFLLTFLVAATIFVGLASRAMTDEDREWLARFGAWILIFGIVWIALSVLVLIAPSGFETLKIRLTDWPGLEDFKAIIVAAVGILSGFLSLAGGFSERSKVKEDPTQGKLSRILSHALQPAGAIFLIFILIGLTYLTTIGLFYAGNAIGGSWVGDLGGGKHAEILNGISIRYLLIAFAILVAIGLIMACFVNVNKFSLHSAYRDRLIRAYLGASNFFRQRDTFTGFDDADNVQLHRLRGQRPFHIINATVNLVSGKNLAWQNRKAASFSMSPLHCGSWSLNYRNTNEYCRKQSSEECKSLDFCNRTGEPCSSVEACQLRGKAIRLGTAMAISGAAADPNMGYISSSLVSILLSLFNIRLGWWLGNTGKAGSDYDWFNRGRHRFFEKSSPSIAVLPLINETLGRTDEDKHFLNVTDGGHFENLALYEMVLRRCKFIVLSDAAADGKFTFGEISNAIEKCKVDLGVGIRFYGEIPIYPRNSDKIDGIHNVRFAIAEITYPEKDDDGVNLKGFLLYTRPAFYDTEPIDIKHYADENPTFPHQSTSDQMYDEKQFEAYRGLGFLTMEEIIDTSKPASLLEFMDLLRRD
jgi:hypothetical protein